MATRAVGSAVAPQVFVAPLGSEPKEVHAHACFASSYPTQELLSWLFEYVPPLHARQVESPHPTGHPDDPAAMPDTLKVDEEDTSRVPDAAIVKPPLVSTQFALPQWALKSPFSSMMPEDVKAPPETVNILF
jgi:hypothetical protein